MRITTFQVSACILACILLAATLCAQQKTRVSQTNSHNRIRKAVIRELGDPSEWGHNPNEIKFVSARFDLDDDGRFEILVWVPSTTYGGTGGYPLLIFREKGYSLKLMAELEQVWSPLIVQNSKRHGWHDIVMQVGGGGPPLQYVVFRHNGRSYSNNFQSIGSKRIRGRKIIGKEQQMTVFGPLPVGL